MAGYFRMEVKVVNRRAMRNNGSMGANSPVKAAAYITADKYHTLNVNALNAAAYISGSVITDGNDVAADYSHKKGVLDSWVMLPDNAPKGFNNPQILWNSVEHIEANCNAALFREFIICFDKHLTLDKQKQVATEFGQSLVDEGMAVHIALHDQKDGNGNYHMHVLCPMRGFNDDGSWQRKSYPRGYLLDENGHRIPMIDKKTGQQKIINGRLQWKREPTIHYLNDWGDIRIDNVTKWRKRFCEIENQYLPEQYQVSPLSYEAQGIDKMPGKHLGKAAYNVHNKLVKQVDSLSDEKKQNYLSQILEIVKHEYRSIYYTNSRLQNSEQKMHGNTEDNFSNVKMALYNDMHNNGNYVPTKEYVFYSNSHKSKLQIAHAFAELIEFYRRMQFHAEAADDAELTMQIMEKVSKLESVLLILVAYGMTAVSDNMLTTGLYDMQHEVIKTLGAEIKETEREIELLKLDEGDIGHEQYSGLQEKLEQYRERIRCIREEQDLLLAGRAGQDDTGLTGNSGINEDEILQRANRISNLSREFDCINEKLGDASEGIEEAKRRIAELGYRESEKRIREPKKATKRIGK